MPPSQRQSNYVNERDFDIMYTITTSPGGRTDTADTIPHALAALVNQLTTGLPDGPAPGASPTPTATSTAAAST